MHIAKIKFVFKHRLYNWINNFKLNKDNNNFNKLTLNNKNFIKYNIDLTYCHDCKKKKTFDPSIQIRFNKTIDKSFLEFQIKNNNIIKPILINYLDYNNFDNNNNNNNNQIPTFKMFHEFNKNIEKANQIVNEFIIYMVHHVGFQILCHNCYQQKLGGFDYHNAMATFDKKSKSIAMLFLNIAKSNVNNRKQKVQQPLYEISSTSSDEFSTQISTDNVSSSDKMPQPQPQQQKPPISLSISSSSTQRTDNMDNNNQQKPESQSISKSDTLIISSDSSNFDDESNNYVNQYNPLPNQISSNIIHLINAWAYIASQQDNE